MNKKQLKQTIIIEKITLNFLLKFLSPSNSFIVYISQVLDKHVWRYQHLIYRTYKRKHSKKYVVKTSKAA